MIGGAEEILDEALWEFAKDWKDCEADQRSRVDSLAEEMISMLMPENRHQEFYQKYMDLKSDY